MMETENNYYDKTNDVWCIHPEVEKLEVEEITVKKYSVVKKVVSILLVISMCLMSVGFLF